MVAANQEIKDKVVLVTGAGKGIGRAVARVFAGYGALVAANDITPVNLDETIARINNEGGRARDYVCDIAKRLPVRNLVDQIIADWGRIDFLVNCAKVEPSASLLDMDEWDWHRTLDVNLGGAFYTLQAVGGIMRAQRSGVIVNFALDLSPGTESPGRGAYITSQNGLIGFTKAAARELAAYRIGVYAICRDDQVTALGVEQDESLVTLPEGLAATPDKLAQIALHLCGGGKDALK